MSSFNCELSRLIYSLMIKYQEVDNDKLYLSVCKFYRKKINREEFQSALLVARTKKLSPILLEKREKSTKLDRLKNSEPLIVRFSPCPSSFCTLGHFKGLYWNYYLSQVTGGRCYLRFDDTNPDHDYLQEYVDSFLRVVDEHNFKVEVDRSSDHFEDYIVAAKTLFLKGRAYVCKCTRTKIQSECTPECLKNNSTFDLEQLIKVYSTGAVRFIGADSNYVILRKKKKILSPTLALQGVVDDKRANINLIIRGRDLESLTFRQKQLYNTLYDEEYPQTIFWGRITLYDSVTGEVFANSKRKIDKTSDPALTFPYYHAFRNIGVKPEVLRQCFLQLGLAKNDAKVDIRRFYRPDAATSTALQIDSQGSYCYAVIHRYTAAKTVTVKNALYPGYWCYDNKKYYFLEEKLYQIL